jgi:hypothetical protein
MDEHPVVFLLWLLSLPVWSVLWLPLFVIMIKRWPKPWVGLLAALPCVALTVAWYAVLAQGLEEPQHARIAVVAYGGPAAFFILLAATSWLTRRALAGCQPRGQAAVGRERENEAGEQGGGKKMV